MLGFVPQQQTTNYPNLDYLYALHGKNINLSYEAKDHAMNTICYNDFSLKNVLKMTVYHKLMRTNVLLSICY